jgi:hypothetical protein
VFAQHTLFEAVLVGLCLAQLLWSLTMLILLATLVQQQHRWQHQQYPSRLRSQPELHLASRRTTTDWLSHTTGWSPSASTVAHKLPLSMRSR